MKKKLLVPALALTIIGAGVGGTVLTTSAFAANTDSNSNKVEVSDKQEQKQLKKAAVITRKEAISAALKEVAGKAVANELEDEDGTIVYSVVISDHQGKKHEVMIDAKTGKVVKVETDDENEKGDKEDKDGEVSDKLEQQQLEKKAKVSPGESAALALKEVKGQVTDIELEDEDGNVVYSVEIKDDQGKMHDVKVDAITGKFLKVEADDEEDSENN